MNKILLLVLVLPFMISCASGKGKGRVNYHVKKSGNTEVVKEIDYDADNEETATLADKVIWSAFKYRGVKYKYGGSSAKGMDCSGLVMQSFKERGVILPRSSIEMSKRGQWIPLRLAKRGDLIFFKTNRRKPTRITHVGIVTHIKDGGIVQFLHSSTSKGVVLNRMDEAYYKSTFAGVRRVLK